MEMKKRLLLALVLLGCASRAFAQGQPVFITNTQAVDFVHDAALSLGTASGPLGMCRTSAARPTAATGDTRAFAQWCNLYGATHEIPTDNAGNDLSTFAAHGYYITTTASTNSINAKNTAGMLHVIHLYNSTATIYYLRLYDSSTAPTCSSATNFVESIPLPPGQTNGRVTFQGEPYTNGIGYCITGGAGSTDATNAAVGIFGKLEWH
jgi:hypothetical protein